ncbi:MAG: diguanylate phosphodiesterase [Sphingomonas sp.]|uniref:EAL domain-containing protein n=1 Tax=Sphingomonas sp. TaxID=28214 RepID=UPI000DBC25D7|nr:EAL domain-containing protein [Sphingomonas sp.]PZU74966.1 MAG: diguanylate phosphodiesterase [Sphingomonas sp.]
MAFQPIVDITTGSAWAYEALVRGTNGESAGEMIGRVTEQNRYAFDQQCRVAAITQAVAAGIVSTGARLSINFLPNAVYSPLACIQLTLKTAAAVGFPTERLIFEFTENEEMADTAHVATIVDTYRRMGFATALDDFGAGHAGLSLLARLQTDVVKLDMELIRNVDTSMPRCMIVEGLIAMFERMGIAVVAEGVETVAEYETLCAMGVRYMQGYLIARPALQVLPVPVVPDQPLPVTAAATVAA